MVMTVVIGGDGDDAVWRWLGGGAGGVDGGERIGLGFFVITHILQICPCCFAFLQDCH